MSGMTMQGTVVQRCPLCSAGERKRIGMEGAARASTGAGVVRCRACSLVYREQANARGHDVGSEELLPPVARCGAAWIFEALEARDGVGSLLDVDCGDGAFLDEARRRGWVAHGVERVKTLVRAARRRGLENVTEGRLDDLDLTPGSLDAVTLRSVIGRWHDPRPQLEALRRWLRPGGTMVLETVNFDGIARRFFGNEWSSHHRREHVFLTVETTHAMLESAGFEPIRVRTGRFCGDRDQAPRRRSRSFVNRALDVPLEVLSRLSLLHWGERIVAVARRPVWPVEPERDRILKPMRSRRNDPETPPGRDRISSAAGTDVT